MIEVALILLAVVLLLLIFRTYVLDRRVKRLDIQVAILNEAERKTIKAIEEAINSIERIKAFISDKNLDDSRGDNNE